MTLPTTPGSSMSLSQIQTEFGGANPIPISEYYSAHASLPASGVISFSDFSALTDSSGTLVWAGYTQNAANAGSCFLSVTFQPDGSYDLNKNGTLTLNAGDWGGEATSQVGADWEMEINSISNGSATSGSAVGIHNLGSIREVRVDSASGTEASTINITMRAASGSGGTAYDLVLTAVVIAM